MIQQVGVTQQTRQTSVKLTSSSTSDNFERYLHGVHDESETITVDKYRNKWKFDINIGNSEFGEYFTKDDIQRWRKSIDNVDATYCAFLQFVSWEGECNKSDVSFSMSYYDFCYLLEQGEIVNEQNVGFTEEIIKSRNWDFSVMLTETFGVRNVEQNKQQLDIMRAVMDLGMVSKDRGLMSPEDVRELLAKKKFEEQQLLLERAFEKKHLLQQQLQSNE